jgi:hypothetical protein
MDLEGSGHCLFEVSITEHSDKLKKKKKKKKSQDSSMLARHSN